MKKLVALLLILVLVFSITACSKDNSSPDNEGSENGEQAESKFGGELKVGITTDVDMLNPLVSNDRVGSWILNNIYPTLMIMNEKAEKVPYIAESITTSEDGKTVTVKLKDGLKWQDGEPLTSADVKFTGDILYEYKLQWQADVFDQVVSVKTPDDLTIVYQLKQPYPGFITTLGFWQRIVPKHIWEKVEDPKTYANEQPVGLGPYKLSSYEKGQYYTLERVDEWFGSPEGKPYLDKVTFRIYPDINTMVLALKTGEIDLTAKDIPHSAAAELSNNKDFTVAKTPSLGYVYIGFNYTNEFLKDNAVRKAISEAIDREKIITMALEGDGMTMPGPISPVYKEYQKDEFVLPQFDVETSKKTLSDAGYKDSDGDGILNSPSGKNVSLELMYDGNDMYLDKTAQILVSNLKDVGIELKLKPLEKSTYSDLVFNQKKFDINLGGWGIIEDVFDSMYTLFHSTAQLNFMGLNNPKLDEYMEGSKFAATQADIDKNMDLFQEEFIKEVPVVPLYVQEYNFAYSNAFDGFKLFPSDLKGLVDPQSLCQVYKK